MPIYSKLLRGRFYLLFVDVSKSERLYLTGEFLGCGLQNEATMDEKETHRDPSRKISEELAKWIGDLRALWSGKIECPLSVIKRFAYAYAGSFTLFLAFSLVRLSETVLPGGAERRDIVSVIIISPEVWLIFAFFPPLLFAWLVTWPERKHSPMRLYLAGLGVSTLVCLLVMRVIATPITPKTEQTPIILKMEQKP